MPVLNIHERIIAAPLDSVGRLIDSLSSPDDRLWPQELWPAMRFDRPLAVGARGGHGPIRYDVAAYAPGRSVRFRFTGPKGFNGFHELAAEPSRRRQYVPAAHLADAHDGTGALELAVVVPPIARRAHRGRTGQSRAIPRPHACRRALVAVCATAAMGAGSSPERSSGSTNPGSRPHHRQQNKLGGCQLIPAYPGPCESAVTLAHKGALSRSVPIVPAKGRSMVVIDVDHPGKER